jgi:hypothetical protein
MRPLSLPETSISSMEIFEYVRRMDSYPNVSIAYWILFTVFVTVTSTERSFSKLKLLKNYLRSTMSIWPLCVLRREYWTRLISIPSSMTSHQEMLEETFMELYANFDMFFRGYF